ncbi:MAG: hypothetical protein WAT37_20355 [Saprospiraceae bacterium]|nr:hypothetical protein [Saprospiraceae bacterium]MBP6234563.1 hypothetical protein [Saprospiraceae bacterium]
MKHLFFSTLLVFVSVSLIQAQEYKKQLKNANKTLGKYYLDPVTNKADLASAIATIDQVFSADDAKADPEAWITKGQIFNEIAKAEMNKKILDPAYMMATPDAGLTAMDAFENAISKAVKKSQTKDALAGVRENEDYVNNIAITFFQAQDYSSAYKNFASTLKANEILKKNSVDSRLDDPTIKNDQTFYTAVSGYFGDNKEASFPLFEQLYKAGNAQPLVYEALFNMASEKDITKAMEFLDAGRKANPDDNGLLFAEINYYLKVGQLDVLTDKLKAAIAKEPDNVSVYTTLGNVYDQLNQKERAAGNIEKADEYFNSAFDYFTQALAKDPKNFDATYSQGALYYNKAASMTTKLNELGNDYSSAGTKKYNAIKAEMDGYFKQALPYFLKAEELDPKDQNTMIALKEIYAREGQLEKSAEYKAKIEALGSK